MCSRASPSCAPIPTLREARRAVRVPAGQAADQPRKSRSRSAMAMRSARWRSIPRAAAPCGWPAPIPAAAPLIDPNLLSEPGDIRPADPRAEDRAPGLRHRGFRQIRRRRSRARAGLRERRAVRRLHPRNRLHRAPPRRHVPHGQRRHERWSIPSCGFNGIEGLRVADAVGDAAGSSAAIPMPPA